MILYGIVQSDTTTQSFNFFHLLFPLLPFLIGGNHENQLLIVGARGFLAICHN